MGGLKPQRFTVSRFWRPKVQDQGVGRALLPLQAHRGRGQGVRNLFLPLCWFLGSLAVLGFFFFFLTMPPNTWDLSSPTRYQTQALEAWKLNHWTTREVRSLVFSTHSYITAVSTSIFTGLLPMCPCLCPNFPLLIRTSVILDL